ncbi:B12-binding domain-containing radical SAM protein [Cognatazoarcus halotolerans]|uniref:B12-binding domain-containing radical SAM protein n=1 Tax=Cognatazoarcus halotolerans TaxID=2686016 RepID=UPI0013596B68|nr:radical SAM protein [Cognatazoarcus halotolerans]MCP5233473.1 B12-binding domain-containing radical SAM protein [Zoogloeaceae bacterium]
MGLDVLLINPPSTEDTPSVPHEVGEPIGLCYLAAALRAQGISVDVLDGFTLGLSVRQLVEITLACNPRVCVGVSILETSALASARYVRKLRRAGFSGHICAGNYYATLNPERTFALAPDIDSIVRGEGEQVFTKLVDHLRRHDEGWRQLQGVCHVRDGQMVNGGLAPQPAINEILEPIRDCLSQTLDAGGTANLVTGRGCYANCSFCSIVAFTGAAGDRFRVRDEEAVVREMARLARDFGILRYLVPDDNFMLPGRRRAPRVEAFCNAIQEDGVKMEFTITCRVDDIHDDLVARLKDSGLVGVYLGIESFQKRRLKLFNKGVKPDENFRAFDILDRFGIFAKIGFIMFDPFMTVQEAIEELCTLRDRVMAPTVIHTSIDNLIRHSTYPLELQAGTPVQKNMSVLGRAFEAGAGYDYYFDHPNIYALCRFAGGLLRFEGPTFAPLRALSYRLCFCSAREREAYRAADEACTQLWKAFGAAHFAVYLRVANWLNDEQECDAAMLIGVVAAHQQVLERLRHDAWDLIHRAGLADLERPWVRFVDLNHGETLSRVYDPARSTWYEMSRAERAVLRLWSRTSSAEILQALRAEFDELVAREAMARVTALIERGAFVGTREVEAPLNLDDFSRLIRDIIADLHAGRRGPRPCDVLPAVSSPIPSSVQ